MLGPLMAWTDEDEPVKIPAGQVLTVLAVLLVHRGRPVSTDRLIDVLWPRRAPRDAPAALQVKVSQLRSALAAAEPSARTLVVSGAAGYGLDVPADAVDAGRFEELLGTGADARSRANALSTALGLWRGAAFSEVADEEFAAVEAARLTELRLSAVEARAEALLELGEHAELVGELAPVIAEHPLRERLRAAHLRALYRTGRQSEALAGFTELRDRLRTELGVDPGPEIVAVHQAILEQDPLIAPRPATTPTNLPGQLTELIGRAEATRDVCALVGEHRLVTLIGPGGVGKTRLGVEAARSLIAEHSDGVWFVELAGIDKSSSHTAIVDTVHAVLGIRDDGRSSAGPVDQLITALEGKRVLLVLDNCEHLVAEVAELTERLLRSVPGLRVLATSQEPLGVSGEALYPVAALELPHSPADSGAEALPKFSAVRLFAARAAATAPGFTIDAGNAAAVAGICRRLDGIPLALELAAARVRALGIRELAARMDDRFELLVVGNRSAPGRQQTLRAVIDWSWEQLTEPEQAVLRRLSVHADGFGLAAAEHVCASEELSRGRILDLLARLVDRSLIAMTDTGEGPRYRLLESVALYCSDRLAQAGEADLVREARNEYYTSLAEQARDRLRGADQRRWLAVVDTEYANLRSAVEDSVRRGDSGGALRLVDALAWYWFLRGRLADGIRLLDAALSTPGDPASALRARANGWRSALMLLSGSDSDRTALVDAGLTAFDRVDDPAGRAFTEWLLAEALLGGGDQSVGDALAQRALAGFRAVGDEWGIAAASSSTAHHALLRGDVATLERDATESARIFAGLGDRWGQLRAAGLLARRAEVIGDYAEAARLLRDGLRRGEELGLWPQVADMLSGLGRLALLAGDLDQARLLHERARDLSAAKGHVTGRYFAEAGLGLGARREGRLDDAERHIRVLLDWNRSVGYAPGIAHSLAELGFIAELRGDPEQAHDLHEEGLAVARESGDPRAVALALEGLAGAAVLAGNAERAQQLLSAAEAERDSAGAPLPEQERADVDRISAAIRAAQSTALP
ncbi:Predicted ATPase [Saccharopolyspora antimicrobica]|uniref:ATPase n=1 Tax=Saccharopolyspora antimicrobica TaxID=455193 RepID=A0A1I5DQE8_9PSEU|nr:putative ATPase [Saccharopolyspora antimicrobica]SFO01310.1 Predicted ATPase [Saccharopolyspora antimicrobica]